MKLKQKKKASPRSENEALYYGASQEIPLKGRIQKDFFFEAFFFIISLTQEFVNPSS